MAGSRATRSGSPSCTTETTESCRPFRRGPRCALTCLPMKGPVPSRDHLAACWPAYSRHWIGERTGYSEVRLVRPGTVIKITPREPPSLDVEPAPWMPADDLHDRARPELLELAYEELADTVRNTLSLPGDSHRADLTGGKDTRLITSIVLRESLAERFRFQTFGPPTLPRCPRSNRPSAALRFATRGSLRTSLLFGDIRRTDPFVRGDDRRDGEPVVSKGTPRRLAGSPDVRNARALGAFKEPRR